MKKKYFRIWAAVFLCVIVSFVNTKIVVLNYMNEPEDFGIESAQGYGVMCVYVLFPIFCEGSGSSKRGQNYYLVSKETYSYWLYLGKGDELLSQKQYAGQTFYCYDKNKRRKTIEKENYGIACSEEYKEIFR